VVNKSYTKVSLGASLLMFLAGFVSSVAVNSGDELGRVNLLYLVLLYVALPLVSLLLLMACSIKPQTGSLTNILLQLPIWPRSWQESLLELKRDGLFQFWLFGQSQKQMLAFCFGAIVSFMLILLVNDLSFVWRSTLLGAEQIFPVLKAIAWPWSFVESAQPMYQLLASSQDSRLNSDTLTGADYGAWWKFLVMAQLVYGITPRLLLWCWCNFRFKRQLALLNRPLSSKARPVLNPQPPQQPLADIVNSDIDLTSFSLVIWADLPQGLLEKIIAVTGQPQQIFVVGAYGDITQEQAAIKNQHKKLVIVSSWEPPMGELMDFLALGHGYLMPLDWTQTDFNQVTVEHLAEWRRCCFKLSQWQLLQLEQLS